ncbi:MAG: acetyl-CoA carboxylase carboxyltransferase subunit alpha [Candidatus Sumerlaeia bacterium]
MALQTFDFEKPILEIDEEIESLQEELNSASEAAKPAKQKELKALQKKRETLRKKIYAELTPWQRVLIARHMKRPRALDYIKMMMTEWVEMRGDRNFRDDHACVCGMARLNEEPVMVIAQQKGKDTKENVARNFGMMHPEGYRKAMRAMRLAERFNMPIIVLIDTPGAYPGIGAEERGQAEAIARNIMEMFDLKVPVIGVIIGEGASGGALGIGVVNHMMMLENSWYCVISPEGCASILWRDAAMAPTAAEALKMTADDLLKLEVIDEKVPEPLGGAHNDPQAAADMLHKALAAQMERLMKLSTEELVEHRFQKHRAMGEFYEEEAESGEEVDEAPAEKEAAPENQEADDAAEKAESTPSEK